MEMSFGDLVFERFTETDRNPMTTDENYILLTTAEAEAFCKISRTTMWRDPSFPKALVIAKGKHAHRLADLKAWIDQRPVQR